MSVVNHLHQTNQRCRAEDRRQQILETATDLFARQGFSGTTTRQIAEHAQVNEAIIFRHFPTKEDLYWAVIEHKCQQGQGKRIVAECVASGDTPREVFTNIASGFLRSRQQDSSLGRLLLFSALENHELSHRFFRVHIAELYEALGQYIREQMKAGVFRSDIDPLLAARGFWGMVVYHFLIQELFGGKHYHDIDVDQASATLTEMWLRGMLPRPGEEGRCRPKARSRGDNGTRRSEKPSK